MNRLPIYVGCFVLSLLSIDSTRAQTATEETAEPISETRLKKVRLGSIRPITAFGDIYLAGQPEPGEMSLLKSHGIRTVICLRHEKELTWDEDEVVKQADMKYVHVPFQGERQLTPEVFDKVIKVLRDRRRGPVFLHCGAANRVGAIWYAFRVLDGKLTPAAAEKEAKQVGLRTPAYLKQAKEYVKGVQDGTIVPRKLPPVESE